MDENTARTRWCPMIRMDAGSRCAVNWDMDGHAGYTCIASDCMMWVDTGNECIPQPEPKDSSADFPEPICHPTGHCGLVR